MRAASSEIYSVAISMSFANDLRFEYTKYGKPSLIKEFGGSALSFNLSHSKGVALFAFTIGRDLGIDVEWIRADVAEEQIAEHFFSDQEVRALRQLEAGTQAEASLIAGLGRKPISRP